VERLRLRLWSTTRSRTRTRPLRGADGENPGRGQHSGASSEAGDSATRAVCSQPIVALTLERTILLPDARSVGRSVEAGGGVGRTEVRAEGIASTVETSESKGDVRGATGPVATGANGCDSKDGYPRP
jgi:hypothetical protein